MTIEDDIKGLVSLKFLRPWMEVIRDSLSLFLRMTTIYCTGGPEDLPPADADARLLRSHVHHPLHHHVRLAQHLPLVS
jgi:hypothetical protein